MKSLSEMKVAKDQLAQVKGEFMYRATTSAHGNIGSSNATYVDGMYWGQDGSSGSLFGDSWSYAVMAHYERADINVGGAKGGGGDMPQK